MQKILIVDDEAFAREAIKESISWESYQMELICASSGKEALLILQQTNIDVMLIDIKMPRMNGLELLTEVQKTGLDVEVIILSSYNTFDLVRQAMKLGTCDYLFKPTMLPADIIESVQKAAARQAHKKMQKTIVQPPFAKSPLRNQYNHLKELEDLQILQQASVCTIVVFKLLKYQESIFEIFESDIQLMKASIGNVINEALSKSGQCQLIGNQFNEYIALVWKNGNKEELFRGEIEQAISNALIFLVQYYNLDFTVGVSRIGKDVKETADLYVEALSEANKGDLNYQKIFFADSFAKNVALKNELSKTLEFIKENLGNQNLSLQTAADYAGVSRNYFSKIFKEAIGVNFIEYVTRLRVEKARNLYIHTDLKIYEIAEKVGYSDWHYLYSVYKKVLGHSMSKEKKL